MPKKRYCQNCKNIIEEGKEIKVCKGTNYRSSRYSSYPSDYYVFLLYHHQRDKKLDRITKKSQKK